MWDFFSSSKICIDYYRKLCQQFDEKLIGMVICGDVPHSEVPLLLGLKKKKKKIVPGCRSLQAPLTHTHTHTHTHIHIVTHGCRSLHSTHTHTHTYTHTHTHTQRYRIIRQCHALFGLLKKNSRMYSKLTRLTIRGISHFMREFDVRMIIYESLRSRFESLRNDRNRVVSTSGLNSKEKLSTSVNRVAFR